MKKIGMILFTGMLFGASLLAACAQAAAPATATVAPLASVAPLATVAAPATAIPTAPAANVIPVTGNNCTLLSKDEVGKVLGEAVVDLKDPTKNGTLCEYLTQNLILELGFYHTFIGTGNSVNYMKQLRTDGIGAAPEEVAGLGDEALYHGESTHRVLYIRKGDTVYSVGVRNNTADFSISSPDNAQTLEKSLADLLITRVP